MGSPNIIQSARGAPVGAVPPITPYLPLLVVWIVWGSTYLGIAVAVRNGFAPFSLGAIRLSIAGVLMLTGAAIAGRRVVLPLRSLGYLAAFGTLMWTFGNGLVLVALTRVDSGYAALVLATGPLWIATFESALERRVPSAAVVFALLLGFAGIGVLSVPRIGAGGADGVGLVLLLVAAASWAVGFVFQKRKSPELSPAVSAGYQLLFGAVGLAVLAIVRAEPIPEPNTDALLAVAYLVVFGSMVGFGCYIVALRTLPSAVVTTHAYVNPVVALLLGWAALSEPLDAPTWAGSALVLASVAIVFRARQKG